MTNMGFNWLLSSRHFPLLKVLYLVVVSIAAFAIPPVCNATLEPGSATAYYAVAGLLVFQVLLLKGNGISFPSMWRACSRLRWLFVFLIAFSLVPGLVKWSFSQILTDAAYALLMCMQVGTMILASVLVQGTGSPTDLVEGLRRLRLPKLFVYSIDNTLALIGRIERRQPGQRRRGGGNTAETASPPAAGEAADDLRPTEAASAENDGTAVTEAADRLAGLEHASGSPDDQPGALAFLRSLSRGDIGFFVEAVQSGQKRARARLEATTGARLDERLLHDVTVISGIAMLMMSIKILKLLPGVPFASGYKTVLFIPLYILASHRTYSRWGGTVAGSIMGIIGLMIGDGKDALFEVLKHMVPGLVIDLSWPMVRLLRSSRLVYCGLGLIVAFFRTIMDPQVALIIGPALSTGKLWDNPALLAPIVPKVLFSLFFGALSGLVTFYALRALGELRPPAAEGSNAPPEDEPLFSPPPPPAAQSSSTPSSVAEAREGKS